MSKIRHTLQLLHSGNLSLRQIGAALAYSGHRDRRFRSIVTDKTASNIAPGNFSQTGHDRSI